MGFREGQVLTQVELPLASAVIVGGFRTATLQVIATATIGAIVAGGGLGRFIVDGIDQLGGTLLIPPLTFAQVLGATSDSVVLGSQLDDVDLYRPIVEMYVSMIELP
jgi:ABC-type proline/glycine betaine transport system permease subunit